MKIKTLIKKPSEKNTILLGYPCSLSKWITKKPKYEPIQVITMTAGGGMGGQSWEEYIKPQKEIPSNKIKEFTRINGEKILINTKYIVEIEEYSLLTLEYQTINGKYRDLEDLYERDPIGTINNFGNKRQVQFITKEKNIQLIDDYDYDRYHD